MPLDFTAVQQHFERFEGRVRHMYLCTGHRVTIGIGHMIPKSEEAVKLQFGSATTGAITEDWHRVFAMIPGRLAQHYRRQGQPIMSDAEIDRIFVADIKSFLGHLRTIVPDYDKLPNSVQLALLDMIYTLGPTGFSAYKKLLAHVRAHSWRGAAAECERGGISVRGDRHKTIKAMLETPR